MAIKLKRGLEASIPTLQEGEPGFTTDSKKLFVGSDTGNIEIGSNSEISIVDNLTTNDATKVLSAKQGKVLQDTKVSKVTTAGIAAYTKNGTTQSTMNIDNASPTASTLVQRDTSGRIKASAGVANNDAVTVEQLNNALGDIDSALDAILGV